MLTRDTGCWATATLVVASAVTTVLAQGPPASLPASATFEVTSVKRMADPSVQINATFEGPIAIAPNSPPVRLMAMERALLADRFRLQVHQETRQLPVFDLVRIRADRLGPRLVPSDGKCLALPSTSAPIADYTPYCGVKRSIAGALVAKGIPIERFARGGAADAQDLPSITTALKEQLGLELRSTTGPVDVIVIDHVEQPTPD